MHRKEAEKKNIQDQNITFPAHKIKKVFINFLVTTVTLKI